MDQYWRAGLMKLPSKICPGGQAITSWIQPSLRPRLGLSYNVMYFKSEDRALLDVQVVYLLKGAFFSLLSKYCFRMTKMCSILLIWGTYVIMFTETLLFMKDTSQKLWPYRDKMIIKYLDMLKCNCRQVDTKGSSWKC